MLDAASKSFLVALIFQIRFVGTNREGGVVDEDQYEYFAR